MSTTSSASWSFQMFSDSEESDSTTNINANDDVPAYCKAKDSKGGQGQDQQFNFKNVPVHHHHVHDAESSETDIGDEDEIEDLETSYHEEGAFTKCSVCTTLTEERNKTLNSNTRRKVDEEMNKHLALVKNERSVYERHKEKSRSSNKYLTICIDGMDQSKTHLPHYIRKDKSTARLWTLNTHITGALVHSTDMYGKNALMFVNTADIPSDSNLTLNVLMSSLEAYVRKHNMLPEVLYLQFDNCWRENKNLYVLSFAFLLVAMGIVKKVRINFLIVGHTHNDVDQAFSRIAVKLRITIALTLEKLKDVIRDAYSKPIPTVIEMEHLFDFKSWLLPHIAGAFKHHTQPHNFRIKRINGKVCMHYRQYSGQKWLPEGDGLTCLKTLPDLADVPPWVKPNLEKLDISALKSDIPKYQFRMDPESILWWGDYLRNIKEMKKVPPKPTHWLMMTVAAAAGSREDVAGSSQPLPVNVQHIVERLSKEMPAVTIGKQGQQATRTKEQEIPIQELSEFQDIKEGMMVGLYVEDEWPSRCPQVAKVQEIDHDKEIMVVHWYYATWTGKCHPDYKGVSRYRTPVTAVVDIRCTLLWAFSLTRSSRLKGVTVTRLKEAYNGIGLNV